MRSWLPELDFFDDATPRSAGVNMAADEVLLGLIRRPLLRAYRWERPAVSFGYFECWPPVRAAWPDRDAVRRWTGGGVVLHGEDFTYSLLIPRSSPASGVSARESYHAIHHALCSALLEIGVQAAPAESAPAKISQACFENPVLHDVMVNGRKIAGAAQRRTRMGLLHQGSVQETRLPAAFAGIFAERLAARVEARTFEIAEQATALAAEKYAAPGWLGRKL